MDQFFNSTNLHSGHNCYSITVEAFTTTAPACKIGRTGLGSMITPGFARKETVERGSLLRSDFCWFQLLSWPAWAGCDKMIFIQHWLGLLNPWIDQCLAGELPWKETKNFKSWKPVQPAEGCQMAPWETSGVISKKGEGAQTHVHMTCQ